MKSALFSPPGPTAQGVLTGWNRLGIPAGGHVVTFVGTERAKTWRGDNSGAFFGPLGG